MKIGVFCHHFPVLSQTFVFNQVADFIKLGHEVHVITNDFYNDSQHIIDEIGLDKCNITRLEEGSKIAKLLALPLAISKLIIKRSFSKVLSIISDGNLSIIQKLNILLFLNKSNEAMDFDVVVVHFGVNGYYVCKMRELGIISGKVSTIFHGYELSRTKVLENYKRNYKELFEKSDFILPISHHWEKKLLELGAKKDKIYIGRMGISVETFLSEKLESINSPLKIVQVGRLTEKKGVLYSIKAMSLLPNNIDAYLTVVGDGELFDDARKLIEQLGLQNRVRLTGKMAHKDVKKLLNVSDVFLLPSVTALDGDKEGIPVALMEAMAMGLLVISTYHSGIPELIENSVSGFLVEEASSKGISDTICKICMLGQDEINNIRSQAYKVISENYDYKANNKKLLNYIGNAL